MRPKDLNSQLQLAYCNLRSRVESLCSTGLSSTGLCCLHVNSSWTPDLDLSDTAMYSSSDQDYDSRNRRHSMWGQERYEEAAERDRE